MTAIDRFRGDYAFLSNFYPSPIEGWGLTFPTAEHAFVASKVAGPDAQQVRFLVSELGTAAEAKRFGRTVRLRPDWPTYRLIAMEAILRRKFATGPLVSQLLATAPRDLVEGNDWGDTFWGVCRGQGENHLGLLLMKIRFELEA